MPDGSETVTVRVLSSIHDVEATQWNRCANSGGPFVSHDFLSALEDSDSASTATGWMPQHLVVEGAGDIPLAVAPLYLKNHSYGEYVFDWGWADAYQRAGGRYYPKLQSSVPFTPVTGRRYLIADGVTESQRKELETTLASAMIQLATKLGVSSLHIAFQTEDEWRVLGSCGYLQRTGHQFHWQNDNYQNFDDFLATLSSRKRKQINKERREVRDKGLDISVLQGADITDVQWDQFYRFYHDTTDRKWGESYLKRPFFSLMGERMGDQVVLIWVEDQGVPVAAALNLRDQHTLYGRNWGCNRAYKFLHFETCYYAAIEYAIEHGLQRVEAGAQGEHKLQRGYLPSLTYSSHWIAEPGFRQSVDHFLQAERQRVDEEISILQSHSPYKSTS